jgi:hypothetical protein
MASGSGRSLLAIQESKRRVGLGPLTSSPVPAQFLVPGRQHALPTHVRRLAHFFLRSPALAFAPPSDHSCGDTMLRLTRFLPSASRSAPTINPNPTSPHFPPQATPRRPCHSSLRGRDFLVPSAPTGSSVGSALACCSVVAGLLRGFNPRVYV